MKLKGPDFFWGGIKFLFFYCYQEDPDPEIRIKIRIPSESENIGRSDPDTKQAIRIRNTDSNNNAWIVTLLRITVPSLGWARLGTIFFRVTSAVKICHRITDYNKKFGPAPRTSTPSSTNATITRPTGFSTENCAKGTYPQRHRAAVSVPVAYSPAGNCCCCCCRGCRGCCSCCSGAIRRPRQGAVAADEGQLMRIHAQMCPLAMAGFPTRMFLEKTKIISNNFQPDLVFVRQFFPQSKGFFF